MAPLDVVQADSTVATDKQALISSQSNLNYQQLVLKQAIARNLNDPALVAAPIIPTDRVNLDQLPEEKQTPDELAQAAFKNRPELETGGALDQERRNHIARCAPEPAAYAGCVRLLRRARHRRRIQPGILPDSGSFRRTVHPFRSSGYSDVLGNLVNSSSPDKGIGFTFQIPIRNRTAQADQAAR